MKVQATDALKICRLFAIASDDDTPRMIERLIVSHPSAINTMAQFRLHKKQYALLFDDTAHDDAVYIQKQIAIQAPGTDGVVLENTKNSFKTYGVSYEGKDCYLFEFRDGKQRLDVYLAATYPDVSRSSWQKYIKKGFVKVDGTVISAPKYDVSADSQVTTHIPEAPDHSDKTLPIIYEDDDIVVINKPINVLTHPKNPLDTDFSVLDIAKRHWTDEGKGEEDRYGIVHRLDRDTSGVIVIAKHEAAFHSLKAQFSERLAKKTYTALVVGTPKQSQATLDLPILRNPASPGSFMVHKTGKAAVTAMQVDASSQTLAKVTLQPKTGRTHQLRVHMAYIGCPILGDRLYGRKSADRMYLHAHKLSLQIPDGSTHEFVAPIPAAFETTFSASSS